MGCAPSRPSNPILHSRKQNDKPQNHHMKSRLSSPFDPNVPLYNNHRLSRPFDPNIPLYVPQSGKSSSHNRDQAVRPVEPARYEDAYAQLTARSKKSAQTKRPLNPVRHGDAYAQLNARSGKRVQMPRKEQKVQYKQGHRVKSQTAQRVKGDTLYFSS